jgi:hypothetical protein
MMPNNQMQGMLETFLTYLITPENEKLWQFAQEKAQESKNFGAAFTDNQLDKSNIHTYLAWQNPLGNQLHTAIKSNILEGKHPTVQNFIIWFKTLYDLS